MNCIIQFNKLYQRYELITQDGIIAARRSTGQQLLEMANDASWVVLPLNSRAAKTILDKIEGQTI